MILLGISHCHSTEYLIDTVHWWSFISLKFSWPLPRLKCSLLFIKYRKNHHMEHRYQARPINNVFFQLSIQHWLGFQSKPEPNPVKFNHDTLTDLNGLWRSSEALYPFHVHFLEFFFVVCAFVLGKLYISSLSICQSTIRSVTNLHVRRCHLFLAFIVPLLLLPCIFVSIRSCLGPNGKLVY